MSFLIKPTPISPTNGLSTHRTRTRTMMSINTSVNLTILSIRARYQTRHKFQRAHLLLADLIPVFESAFAAVAAVATEVVVVAEFVGGGARFDLGHHGAVNFDGGV